MTGVGRSVLLSLSLILLASASCGSSDTARDLSPAAKAKWNEYCDDRAACQPTTPCPPTTCLAGFAEEAPLIQFVDCQVAKTCGANDDDCIADAGTTDAERLDFTARCVAALSVVPPNMQCALDWPDPSVCTIVAYPIVRKQHLRAVDACLTLPCEQLVACVDAAVEPLNCW